MPFAVTAQPTDLLKLIKTQDVGTMSDKIKFSESPLRS